MKQKVYDEDVREFVLQNKGIFLVFSQDANFNKNLRGTVLRHLLIKNDCVVSALSREQLHKQARQLTRQGYKVFLFVEREQGRTNCNELVQFFKNQYPEMLIVILTTEIARETIVLLHEFGASNVITKPISPDMLIEKIAFTVKPRGQIGDLIDSAKELNETGKYEEAAEAARKILELKPGSPAGLLVLGDSHKGRGDTGEAMRAYTEAANNAKLYLDPLKKIAELHHDTGNISEETKYLERLDKLSPLNVERKVSIGGNYVQLGERDKAVAMFDEAVRLTTREALTQISRISGIIAEQCAAMDPQLAEKYLRQALAAKRGHYEKADLETFNRLGISLRKQGKWEQAAEEYSKAMKISPADAGLHYNLAMAYSDGKLYREACQALEDALRHDESLWGSSETVCYNMALIYYRAGRKDQASEFLHKTLGINPSSERAKAMLREL